MENYKPSLITLNGTYGYKNFISNKDKKCLLEWIQNNKKYFKANIYGANREYCVLKNIPNIPITIIEKLKKRIIELDNIEEWIEDPLYYDFIGINYETGHIQPHKDPNVEGYTCTRYNIILMYPENGGHSIYGNEINILEENMVWKCIAGKVQHASTPVEGNKPRITLSLGFQIKNK
jgi:hypothetical protein